MFGDLFENDYWENKQKGDPNVFSASIDPNHIINMQSFMNSGDAGGDTMTVEINRFKPVPKISKKDQVLNFMFDRSNILAAESSVKLNFTTLWTYIPDAIEDMEMIYSVSDCEVSSKEFHKKCDNKGPYFVLIRAANKHIFGCYIDQNIVEDFDCYVYGHKNFIFSLRTIKSRKLHVFPTREEKRNYSLCNMEEGFCLGMPTKMNRDLLINFNDLSKSSSNLGFAYDNKEVPNDYLAGTYSRWNILDLEVYKVHQNKGEEADHKMIAKINDGDH